MLVAGIVTTPVDGSIVAPAGALPSIANLVPAGTSIVLPSLSVITGVIVAASLAEVAVVG